MAVWDIKERYDITRANQDRFLIAGSRALFMGGFSPSDPNGENDTVDYVSIVHGGTASDFGNLTNHRSQQGGFGSNTRAVCSAGGGPDNGGDELNTIDFGTIMSTGNFIDFGDLTVARRRVAGFSNQTRGISAGGKVDPASKDEIDFVTIASTGDATDFGNLISGSGYNSGCASSTRGITHEAHTPSTQDVLSFITLASTGNATDFGDLTQTKLAATGISSTTRGVFAGGLTPSKQNVIEFITIASTGDGTDFGNLTENKGYMGGTSGTQRGLFAGGAIPAVRTRIESITISTEGNATDFGDLSLERLDNPAGASNAHGGLEDSFVFFFGNQRPSVTYMPGSGRGLLGGGKTNPAGTNQNAIQMIHIQTKSNTSDFGNLTLASYGRSGCASRTRGLFGGGYNDPAGYIDTIESIEFASQGNAADFGDSTVARAFSASTAGNQTRGIIGAGGNAPGLVDVIDYVTIASAGNAADFGNLSAARSQFSGSSSPTRAIFYGGLE